MKNDVGFYSVNGKQFSNKFEAVLDAQKTNSIVEWNFFDEIFNKVDWYTEPEPSLDQFYKIRAEQIRSSYDYVIVFCSGGADSTNVIKTFINNKIKVDEVIGLAPMSGLNNWQFDSANISDLNTISETKFALIPLLNEISNHNIKVTLYDFFEDIVKYKDEEWTFDSCGNIVTALTSHFTNVGNIPHIKRLIDSGKRIALVYGTDKPIVKVSPAGDMFFAFGDGGINYLNMPDSRSYPNVDRVLFYWTPDLPEMLVKQAHVVAKVLHTSQFKDIFENEVLVSEQSKFLHTASHQDLIDMKKIESFNRDGIFKKYTSIKNQYNKITEYTSYRSIYQRAIVPFIYPSTYSKNLFQAQKIELTEGFFTRDQDWVHILHSGTRISDMILSGTKMLYNSILPNYLNYKGTGFKSITKRYKFGNSNQFSPVIL
jgi:hypothetical protein